MRSVRPVIRRGKDLAVTPDDPAHGWVVCRNVDLDGVARDDADHATLAHLARSAGGHFVTCLQLHAERRVRERFNHDALCSEVVVLACDVSLLSIRPSSTAHEGYTADRQHAAAYRSTPRSGTSEGDRPRTTDHGPAIPPSSFQGGRQRSAATMQGDGAGSRLRVAQHPPDSLRSSVLPPREDERRKRHPFGPWSVVCGLRSEVCGLPQKGSDDLRVIPTGTATSTRYLRLGGRPARLIVLRTG